MKVIFNLKIVTLFGDLLSMHKIFILIHKLSLNNKEIKSCKRFKALKKTKFMNIIKWLDKGSNPALKRNKFLNLHLEIPSAKIKIKVMLKKKGMKI